MKRIMAVMGLGFISNSAFAMVNSIGFVSVPALDDVGLVGLASVVALVGAIAVRRRNKK